MKRIFIAIVLIVMPIITVKAQEGGEDLDPQYAVTLLKAGETAPDFTLNDINGKSVSLSSFRGRKVVLDFWASWCPDCRADIPRLKALQAKADPSKVAFVSVSFDRTLDALKTYVNENYLGGVQLFEPAGKKESAIGEAYSVKWIPSLYVIDEEGKGMLGTVMIGKVEELILGNKPAKSLKQGASLCTDESCSIQ